MMHDYVDKVYRYYLHINNTEENQALVAQYGMRLIDGRHTPHLHVRYIGNGGVLQFSGWRGLGNSLIPDDKVEPYLALLALRSPAIFEFLDEVIRNNV